MIIGVVKLKRNKRAKKVAKNVAIQSCMRSYKTLIKKENRVQESDEGKRIV